MNAVEYLESLLAPAASFDDPVATAGAITLDHAIARLQQQARSGSSAPVPHDLQLAAVARFWNRPRFESLREARLVSFGLALPGPAGPSLLDDATRFAAVLEGVDQWLGEPRKFRRCYQGLLRSYFACDTEPTDTPPATRKNWERLRHYLDQRAPAIVDPHVNPDWVTTLVASRHLYSDLPGEPYAAAMLRGDSSGLDTLCECLGIGPGSWFLRRLLQAQIAKATRLGDAAFRKALPALLETLAGHRVLRDRGLELLLERSATIAGLPPHDALRDAALRWWGLPWVPGNQLRWRGVGEAARGMAADWIKAALIDTYFAQCSDDGPGDRRRAEFWKRYVKSMRTVRYVLAPQALRSATYEAAGAHSGWGRFDAIDGLAAELSDAPHAASALVMSMGGALIVEFAAAGDALWAYDLRAALPFDLHTALRSAEGAPNSLRSSRAVMRVEHRDGVDGWRRWEQRCEAALIQQFDLRPGGAPAQGRSEFVDLSDSTSSAAPAPAFDAAAGRQRPRDCVGEDVHWQTAEAGVVPYSRTDLQVLARVHALTLDDQSLHGGKLWVRVDAGDVRIERILARWGFQHAPGTGWWR
jgi:EH_Signature domain